MVARVSPSHRRFMDRTYRIYAHMKGRAAELGKKLDFTVEQLRDLIRPELGQPCPFCSCILATDTDAPGCYWIDHAVPVSRGGSFGRANLVVMCRACNQAKSTLTLAEFIAKRTP
jgi:hypothetical protein